MGSCHYHYCRAEYRLPQRSISRVDQPGNSIRNATQFFSEYSNSRYCFISSNSTSYSRLSLTNQFTRCRYKWTIHRPQHGPIAASHRASPVAAFRNLDFGLQGSHWPQSNLSSPSSVITSTLRLPLLSAAYLRGSDICPLTSRTPATLFFDRATPLPIISSRQMVLLAILSAARP